MTSPQHHLGFSQERRKNREDEKEKVVLKLHELARRDVWREK